MVQSFFRELENWSRGYIHIDTIKEMLQFFIHFSQYNVVNILLLVLV